MAAAAASAWRGQTGSSRQLHKQRIFIDYCLFSELKLSSNTNQTGISEPVLTAQGIFDKGLPTIPGEEPLLPRLKGAAINAEQSSTVLCHQSRELARSNNPESTWLTYEFFK
jgi:hypothetical protein